jgi:hypothetical protein
MTLINTVDNTGDTCNQKEVTREGNVTTTTTTYYEWANGAWLPKSKEVVEEETPTPMSYYPYTPAVPWTEDTYPKITWTYGDPDSGTS